MKISEKIINLIKKMQKNEITESIIYSKIAKFAKGQKNKDTLNKLSKEELDHYNTWMKYTKAEIKPNYAKIFIYSLMARIFGFTFAVKLMENGEKFAQDEYSLLRDEIPESIQIKTQEEEHEKLLLDMLDEERLKYVGSMVLGLNDALVELTGSLAGFTFALQNSNLVALSGLIIGISATFSMASSEFLAAKREGDEDAFKSCLYTGIAYLITVVLLILPYLIFAQSQYITALICMMIIVIFIIAAFTYYTSVAQDKPFVSRFLEMSIISVSVAVISFVVGVLAKRFLGLDI